MEAIKINAKNDSNGNPRRAFLVIDNGEIIDVIDEGYRGTRPLTEKYPGVQVATEIMTTPSEYKGFLSRAETLRTLATQ